MSDVLMNLGMSALTLLLCLLPLWALSVKIKDASIIDIFWGMGFVIIAALCLYLSAGQTIYLKILAALPIIWGLRLSLYLARRNIGHGEVPRYQAMRKRAEKKGTSETSWRRRSFITIFLGQGLLMLIVSAPIWYGLAKGYYWDSNYILHETTPGILTVVGTIIWLIGFLFEAISDWQLSRFKKKNADYDGPYADKPVLQTGLWRFSRHPNYFGNALIWWGIFIVACETPGGWITIFGPLVMTYLLVKVSGKPMLEYKLKKRPAYQDYMNRTPGFIPGIPKKKPRPQTE